MSDLDKNRDRRIGRRKYPLRKVIKQLIDKPWKVELECGHIVNASTDIYGPTCPVRQRCRECYNELNKGEH